MDDATLDNLIDDATHAVNNLIPNAVLEKMTARQRGQLLDDINDAITPVLRDALAKEAA